MQRSLSSASAESDGMHATEDTLPLSVAGREGGDLPAHVAAFLAQRLGESAMRRLVAFHRPAVRQFALAATLMNEAMSNWDGSLKAASRLAKAASFYRKSLADVERAAGSAVEAKARAIRARRSQRVAFHNT